MQHDDVVAFDSLASMYMIQKQLHSPTKTALSLFVFLFSLHSANAFCSRTLLQSYNMHAILPPDNFAADH